MVHHAGGPEIARGRELARRKKRPRHPARYLRSSVKVHHGMPASERAILAPDRARVLGCLAASLGGALQNWRADRLPLRLWPLWRQSSDLAPKWARQRSLAESRVRYRG